VVAAHRWSWLFGKMLALLTIFLGVLIVGGIVGLVLHDTLLTRLRGLDPDLWQALGAPDKVFDDGGLAGLRAVRRLYRQPDLRRRCSPEMVAAMNRARTYGRAYLLFAFVTLAILVGYLGRIL
jgi:hypothetical protein